MYDVSVLGLREILAIQATTNMHSYRLQYCDLKNLHKHFDANKKLTTWISNEDWNAHRVEIEIVMGMIRS